MCTFDFGYSTHAFNYLKLYSLSEALNLHSPNRRINSKPWHPIKRYFAHSYGFFPACGSAQMKNFPPLLISTEQRKVNEPCAVSWRRQDPSPNFFQTLRRVSNDPLRDWREALCSAKIYFRDLIDEGQRSK